MPSISTVIRTISNKVELCGKIDSNVVFISIKYQGLIKEEGEQFEYLSIIKNRIIFKGSNFELFLTNRLRAEHGACY